MPALTQARAESIFSDANTGFDIKKDSCGMTVIILLAKRIPP